MHSSPAIVRFRGTLEPDARRLAVVEFPPCLRTILVASCPYGPSHACFHRCQLPCQIFVIFYDRSADGISLDATPWVGGNAVCFSRVCVLFRNSPMTSIDSPLWRTPFPNLMFDNGAICFGSDPRMNERLYSKHPKLRDLVQTVTECFWGSAFHSNQLCSGCRVGSRRVSTFGDWERESKNPDFLGTVDWGWGGRGLTVHDLVPVLSTLAGWFNPGRRPT